MSHSSRNRVISAIAGLALLLLMSLLTQAQASLSFVPGFVRKVAEATSPVKFGVVGDYGRAGPAEAAVADLIKSWNPDFVITTGDNNYPTGAAATIDSNIGQYYHDYIYPYSGSYGPGATINRFFPTLGNHDWDNGNLSPYTNYFGLPGNERYYDFVRGPVHFFVVDSDSREPDGITHPSSQSVWLQNQLANSTAPWKLVYMHHPPFSSGSVHGSTPALQWPYQAWGASAVLSGHEHDYERLDKNGLPYFVNGLGGASIYSFAPPVSDSLIRYNGDYGAMQVTASDTMITFKFFSVTNLLIDSYTLTKPLIAPAAPSNLKVTAISTSQIDLTWNDNADNEAGFQVERKVDLFGSWSPLPASIGANQISYSDTGLTSGTTYYYRVLAYNQAGNSAYASEASTTTPVNFVVTSNYDNASRGSGTLSYALYNATLGQTISFALTTGNKIKVVGQLPAARPGVKVLGNCAAGKPTILIDGTGVASDGLVLSGSNTLYGLEITHFKKAQIRSSGSGNNLACVVALN